jgi:phthiodiolone/phenolphthiodiolone dimycocerosates ketoreductase
MFPSRIFLGLGAGDPINQAPIGIPTDHRFSKLAEGLEIMKILWDSNIQNPKSFHGKYYNLKRAYLQLGQEKRPFPDIYLAAFGARMLKLTGKDANGWIPHCHTSETYKNDLAIIMRSRQKGSNPSRFHSAYYTLTSISKNREQANQRVLGPAKYFLALIPEALKKIDPTAQHPGRVWENIADPRVQRETIRKIATPIPDKDAYDTVIHGSADDCIGQIENYRRAGCEEFMLTFVNNGGLWSTENLLLQIQYFKKSVIDYYNNN